MRGNERLLQKGKPVEFKLNVSEGCYDADLIDANSADDADENHECRKAHDTSAT